MRLPQVTTRRLMALVALVGFLVAGYRAVLIELGPRPGFQESPYYYVDCNFTWHAVYGGVIWVSESGAICVTSSRCGGVVYRSWYAPDRGSPGCP
jgi:hypothetical protein